MDFETWWNEQEVSKEKPGIPGALVNFFREMCLEAYGAGVTHTYNRMNETLSEIADKINIRDFY